jgi:Flp pilus assembly protein TadB
MLEVPGIRPGTFLGDNQTMATSILVERDDEKTPSTPGAAPTTTPRERSPRRETILLMGLVGLVVAVVLFGLAFPGLLAPAVAIAVLAAIVALDWVLPSGELRQFAGHHRMR